MAHSQQSPVHFPYGQGDPLRTQVSPKFTYKQGLKALANSQQHKENYLEVQLGYDVTLLFTYEEGMRFISALQKAEGISRNEILPFPEDKVSMQIVPGLRVEHMRMATLLGVPYTEVKAAYEREHNTDDQIPF